MSLKSKHEKLFLRFLSKPKDFKRKRIYIKKKLNEPNILNGMRDAIKYKNFIGSVHYAAEDEVFYGKIEGIDDLITFEAENVKDLKEAFEFMVDEHIKDSEKAGVPVKKSYKGSLNIRIPGKLHENAAELAILNGISLNQFIQQAIQHEINHIALMD